MGNYLGAKIRKHVALLTEGVDRNHAVVVLMKCLECRPPHGGRG